MATKYDIKSYLQEMKTAGVRQVIRTNDELQALINALDELEKPRDTTCNGWTNWETWTVRMALDDFEDDMNRLGRRSWRSKSELGDEIKDYIQNIIDELELEDSRRRNRYFVDASVTSFMGEVNWVELAEYVLSNADEDDEYEHEGTWHITTEPSASSLIEEPLSLAFEGSWKECLAFIRERAKNIGDDGDDAAQEIREDGNVIVGEYWYELNQGKADPSDFEVDDSDEPPVRDMDDAGN